MEIKKVAVIGGGTMGNPITHVFAMKGYHVNLVEMKDELIERSLGIISKNYNIVIFHILLLSFILIISIVNL